MMYSVHVRDRARRYLPYYGITGKYFVDLIFAQTGDNIIINHRRCRRHGFGCGGFDRVR